MAENLKLIALIYFFSNLLIPVFAQKADDEFVKESIQLYGSKEAAFNTFIDLGWKNILDNNPENSVKKFNHAWLINPDHPDSFFGFAFVSQLNNKKEDRDKFFEMGIKSDKDHKGAFKYYFRSSDYFDKLKDTLAVIESLCKAVEQDSSSVNIYKKLAYYCVAKSEFNKAIKYYTGAIRLNPDDSIIYFNRGGVYQKLKKHKEAADDYTRVIEHSKKINYHAYLFRGKSRFESSDYANAITDFETCLKLNPKNALLYRFIGSARMMLNDGSGACEAWKAGKKMGDKQSEELYNSKCK
ncbi:MAG: tetratricopeptide repeat protein [Bacteroidia bacterium]|nr:tetratricopeptide repeat protein [Bacteroidia bacterium]